MADVSASGGGREILGRVSTKHGFKDLFVIALEDSIVLTPDSAVGSALHNALPIGALGGLVGALLVRKGGNMADESQRRLADAPADLLLSAPDNVVIPISDLRSIEFTRNLFSAWVEFVRRADRTKFEVNHMFYMALCDATQRRFPALYRSDERTTTMLEKHRAQLGKSAPG